MKNINLLFKIIIVTCNFYFLDLASMTFTPEQFEPADSTDPKVIAHYRLTSTIPGTISWEDASIKTYYYPVLCKLSSSNDPELLLQTLDSLIQLAVNVKLFDAYDQIYKILPKIKSIKTDKSINAINYQLLCAIKKEINYIGSDDTKTKTFTKYNAILDILNCISDDISDQNFYRFSLAIKDLTTIYVNVLESNATPEFFDEKKLATLNATVINRKLKLLKNSITELKAKLNFLQDKLQKLEATLTPKI